MTYRLFCTFAAFAAVACTQTSTAGSEPDDGQAGTSVSDISAATISPSRSAPVDDQLVECVSETANGNVTRQFFLTKDGAVKSYSQMQNFARDMCDPGQPDCALGWQGEKIGLYFKNSNGALNQMLLDLDTMTLERQVTTARNGAVLTTMSCTAGPFPSGVTIE